MHVLDISLQTSLDEFGAARHHTLSLAEAIRARGHDVDLVLGGLRNDRAIIGAFDAITCNWPSLMVHGRMGATLVRLIRTNVRAHGWIKSMSCSRWDVVYERHSIGSFIGAYISRWEGIPLIYEVNGIPDEEIVLAMAIESPVVKTCMRLFTGLHLRLGQAVIVQTEELAVALRVRYKIGNVFVVPNGAEEVAARKQRSCEKGRPMRMCYIGTIDDQHDLEGVLCILREQTWDFRLHIVGEGPARGRYERVCGNDSRFVFLGALTHSESMEEIERADICVAIYGMSYELYRKYGFYMCPMKVFEYLAFGKPTIYVGGRSELIDLLERRRALVIASSNESFMEKLCWLRDDGQARDGLAEKGLEVAREFTWEASADGVVGVARGLGVAS